MSGTIVCVDGDVVVTQITCPDGIAGIATPQVHPHRNFALFHDPLAILFTVQGITPTLGRHMHIIQKELDFALIQISNTGITDGCENTSQIGITGKKCGLDQR